MAAPSASVAAPPVRSKSNAGKFHVGRSALPLIHREASNIPAPSNADTRDQEVIDREGFVVQLVKIVVFPALPVFGKSAGPVLQALKNPFRVRSVAANRSRLRRQGSRSSRARNLTCPG